MHTAKEGRKKVAALTLGCKVNAYDTEAMLELFEDKGYEVVEFSQAADIYIINTCTVTNLGDRKSRQMIRRARKQNPEGIIAACGCYAQVAPKEVSDIDEVDLVIGTKDRLKIVERIENHAEGSRRIYVEDISDEYENLSVTNLKNRTRAYVKIQEGCNNYCSYCIIPYARGPVRSRSAESTLSEISVLAGRGFKEVVLSGIHVASYGKDLEGDNLSDLVQQIQKTEGIERIRFSSLDPRLMTEEFVDVLLSAPKVCDHFHLSLQSGSKKVLTDMNRAYTPDFYWETAERIYKAYPNAALTTDVIAGFPGETDTDYRESYDFCKAIGFSKIHVFPFSAKKGTRAYEMNGQIPDEIKQQRSRELLKLSDDLRAEFLKRFKGSSMDVLFEKKVDKGIYEGHTTNYINVLHKTEGRSELENEITNVSLNNIK